MDCPRLEVERDWGLFRHLAMRWRHSRGEDVKGPKLIASAAAVGALGPRPWPVAGVAVLVHAV